MTEAGRFLIIDTSHKAGFVAVARGAQVLAERRLAEARRHARDLAPATQDLLAEQGWKAADLTALIVSHGPGSYTGLRVGLMSAKTLAYATGCALLAVDTFLAIAVQAPAEALVQDVIADAQQERIYQQRFGRDAAGGWSALQPLAIVHVTDWLSDLRGDVWVSGPGLELYRSRLPAGALSAERATWTPSPASLLEVALERWRAGERDDPFIVEPLYLRPSAAEEKWRALGRD